MSFTVVEKDSNGLTSIDSFKEEHEAFELFDGLLDYFKDSLTLEEIAVILQIRKFTNGNYSIEMVETV